MHERGRAGYTSFVAARQTALLRSATLMTGDVHLAQDLLQDALLTLAMRWHRVEGGNPDAYVRKVLYRDLLRWRTRVRAERLMPTVDVAVAPDHAGRADDRTAVLRALRQLSPRQRAVVVLRYVEDLPESETAEVLGISVGTVKSYAHHGLLRLRALLASEEGPGTLEPGTKKGTR